MGIYNIEHFDDVNEALEYYRKGSNECFEKMMDLYNHFGDLKEIDRLWKQMQIFDSYFDQVIRQIIKAHENDNLEESE